MFSLIPSDANDPQGLMRRKEPYKQSLGVEVFFAFVFVLLLIFQTSN